MEGIERGVDLADFLLLWSRGLFFHNRLHPRTLAHHSPVSKRMVEIGAEQSHGRILSGVEGAELPYRFSSNQRSVPGEHDDLVVSGCRTNGPHNRVPGATLFALHDPPHPPLPSPPT